MEICHYCKKPDKELRPYGPSGAKVCYACAFATPERTAQTEAAFDSLLEANAIIGGGIVVIGEEDGPRPL